MPLALEARYLKLAWKAPGQVAHFEVAPEPVDIEEDAEGVLRIESQIFHDVHPWLGLRLRAELEDAQPALIDARGHEHPMLAVDDGGGGRWWVQNDGWDVAGHRHLSELHRTAGRFEVRLGERRLLIDNQTTGLGQADLNAYLHDFQNDLIWMLLSAGSGTAAGRGSLSVEELPDALTAFAQAAARVAAHPAKALRETSAETPRSRLRPNLSSFRQHARNPARMRLTGRASEESPDTGDNRFLRHTVQRCARLALMSRAALRQQAERFQHRADVELERERETIAIQVRKVDPAIFAQQLQDIDNRLRDLESWRPEESTCPHEEVSDFEFEIGRNYGSSVEQYFCTRLRGRLPIPNGAPCKYMVIALPSQVKDLVHRTLVVSKRFEFRGRIRASVKTNRNGEDWYLLEFDRLERVYPHVGGLEAKQKTQERLIRQNWQQPLSAAEREEMRREADTARSRAHAYHAIGQRTGAASTRLADCHAELRRQDAHWAALDVSPQTTFPMGMRYVLSPAYAAVIKAYAAVQAVAAQAGLNDDVFDDLNRVGIMHASALYERWCLVKIIGVLIDDFGFTTPNGWQEGVLQADTARERDFSLQFTRSDVALAVTLDIQPVLANGRRPDFRLRFDSSTDAERTLVLDAKFRTAWRPGELDRVLTELIDHKGYHVGCDGVFVLHPQPGAIPIASSPLAWGAHCDYGQKAPKNHSRGCILLSVGVTQHLRRLIAMGLQASFPRLPDQPAERPEPQSLCIGCGARHEPANVILRQTKARKPYWLYECGVCQKISTRTHCYSCDETLFKNGTDLTYHASRADHVTNVECPVCGAYFDEDVAAALRPNHPPRH